MSPWGKFYLENVDYNQKWWEPFGSWRMHGIMQEIVNRWGWRVSHHLDLLAAELQHTHYYNKNPYNYNPYKKKL